MSNFSTRTHRLDVEGSAEGRAQRTRREMLDAAWDLISQRGAEVSMAEIANAVGKTRQSVYVHFGSRAGLLTAMVRRADERFEIRRSFEAAMRAPSARQRFEAVLAAWLDFVPRIHPVACELIRLRPRDEAARDAWADRMKDLLRFLRRVVRDLDAEGDLAPGWTVQRAADYLWAGCSVQTFDLLVGDRGWTPAQASRAISRGLVGSLVRKP